DSGRRRRDPRADVSQYVAEEDGDGSGDRAHCAGMMDVTNIPLDIPTIVHDTLISPRHAHRTMIHRSLLQRYPCKCCPSKGTPRLASWLTFWTDSRVLSFPYRYPTERNVVYSPTPESLLLFVPSSLDPCLPPIHIA